MSHEPQTWTDERSNWPTVTTAEEVVATFQVTSATISKYDSWRADKSRAQVVELVSSHTTVELYRLTLDDVRRVCGSTSHALADASREDAERVPKARDWYPRFAFTHLMHHYLEQQKELPTWQKISRFFFRSDEGVDLIGRETRELVARIVQDGVTEQLADRALQWRFGNAYYSFCVKCSRLWRCARKGLTCACTHWPTLCSVWTDGWMTRSSVFGSPMKTSGVIRASNPPAGRNAPAISLPMHWCRSGTSTSN
ncbi:hypothetical protein [Amycolatopsis sp. WQ 127309]|uniref:hypothetical protein n=1 Tax=Amycolatopsis sp. WQ 127309 TaxID=2932773 RepID=UPI001FF3C1FD|nr:hypothetical protein [Amycolatopsis sp. WQ 127309]UOZ05584.1 hypothetical protein MUY22_43290 [Amycolatopsis sp. WQ 127309]